MNDLLTSIPKETFFCNDQWLSAEIQTAYEVTNPSDGQVICRVAGCGQSETVSAIKAAKSAQKPWSKKEALFRTNVLRRWNQLILEHKDQLAEIITLESGKPIKESLGEVIYGAGFVEWFAEQGMRISGGTAPSPTPDKRTLVIKQPIGVVAAITPWNFPVAMITRKVAPALAAGCTCVVKPAEDTPLSALALAYLAQLAGFPPGILNVVTAENGIEVGKSLCESKTVRKLSFTGSTAVGKILMAQCAGTLKRLSFELGGNAPFIVFEDANIDQAVEGAIASKFRNTGQTCVCANRIFVHNLVLIQFTEKFVQKVEKLSCGHPMEANDIGPLINNKAFENISALIQTAKEQGGEILTGGTPHSIGGNFMSPTVIGNVNQKSELAQQEIFGPVAPILSFDSDEQVIQMANDTDSGLAAYFYSKNIDRIWRVAEELEYGMVGVNTGMITNIASPFGGIKESGFGREGSQYGIEEYLDIKSICLQLDNQPNS